MLSNKSITDKLAELKKDERLYYPVATIEVNAPLALIQLEFETKISTLEWVLEITGKDRFYLEQRKKRLN